MSSWFYSQYERCIDRNSDNDSTLSHPPLIQIAFYVTARLFIVALHLSFAISLKHMRPILIAMTSVNIIASAIWIGSIFVPLPQRFGMLWVAITIGGSHTY